MNIAKHFRLQKGCLYRPPLINTAALARCSSAIRIRKLFQQFAAALWVKPFKRLKNPRIRFHRAEAAVLMKSLRFSDLRLPACL